MYFLFVFCLLLVTHGRCVCVLCWAARLDTLSTARSHETSLGPYMLAASGLQALRGLPLHKP